MKRIPFLKYTSYGNNFVVLDETETQLLSEGEKRKFAYQATNTYFGIGSDNLLVIQKATPEALQAINNSRHYWSEVPDSSAADYIFRMFEPDGDEALSCGNGLMCIANYLYQQYGIESTRIMTEVPFAEPNIIEIGCKPDAKLSWANMGQPRKLPETLVNPAITQSYDDYIDTVDGIKINFRSHDLTPFSDDTSISLSGYLVFTGEPHLVIFPDSGFSVPRLGNPMFTAITPAESAPHEKRISFGSWLIDHIGNYINKHYQEFFPAGLNVNFVHIDEVSGEVLYRCYERGINRETLACGTGALAVSYVVNQLGLIKTDNITVAPHRCNWHQPTARIWVEGSDQGWLLKGKPTKLLEGEFLLPMPHLVSEQKQSPGKDQPKPYEMDSGSTTPAAYDEQPLKAQAV